jgi:putative ABC transport system permease protein
VQTYKVHDQKGSEMTSNELLKLDESESASIYTYYNEYKKGLEMAGINLFLLGFLGLVFLAATGSIIYFKQLTEAHADRGKYDILRKLGVSKKEIRSTIAKQTAFVLALPLLIGIVHSMMILEGIKTIYGASYYNLTIPTLLSMSAYFTIYLGYYVLTLYSYNNLVNK